MAAGNDHTGATDMARVFEPVRLAGLTLRNRLKKAATFESRSPGGVPSAALADFHAQVAAGGTALTTVSYCAVSTDARTFENQMYMHEGISGELRRLSVAVHAQGGAIAGQLAHCGAFTRLRPVRSRRPKGASARLNDYGVLAGIPFADAMGTADFEALLADYASAARILVGAGFDALEIHMGHGYLLSQFISPATNKRRDEYGGTLANRLRLPLRALDAVRKAVGDQVPLIAKINLADGFKGGLETDESVEACKLLARAGIDAIEMSGGFVSKTPMYLFRGANPIDYVIKGEANPLFRAMLRLVGRRVFRSDPFTELFFLDQARRVRAAVDVPLIYLGGATSAQGIHRAIVTEGFDLVSIGRALLHDPYFTQALRTNPGHVSPCNHCNACVGTIGQPEGTRCLIQA